MQGVLPASPLALEHGRMVFAPALGLVCAGAVWWPQGEVTVVVEGCVAQSEAASPEDVELKVSRLLQEGHAPSQAARMAAKALGVSRNEAYDAALRLGKG